MYTYDYNTYNTSATLPTWYYVMILAFTVVGIVSLWKIFTKAGKPGWASIVPVYNVIVSLQICDLPLWYIVLLFIPFVNVYAVFKIYIELAHKFGKSTGFGVLCVFFSIVCLPILAFDNNATYNG